MKCECECRIEEYYEDIEAEDKDQAALTAEERFAEDINQSKLLPECSCTCEEG